MLRPDAGVHNPLSIGITLDQGDVAGVGILTKTAIHLTTYFTHPENPPIPFSPKYLTDQTRNYLSKAVTGFYLLYPKDRELDPEDLRYLLKNSQKYLGDPDPQAHAAYQCASIVFATIPEMVGEIPELQTGILRILSRTGVYNPPVTTLEYRLRLAELQEEVDKVAWRSTQPTELSQGKVRVARMYAFFQVGAQLQPTAAFIY